MQRPNPRCATCPKKNAAPCRAAPCAAPDRCAAAAARSATVAPRGHRMHSPLTHPMLAPSTSRVCAVDARATMSHQQLGGPLREWSGNRRPLQRHTRWSPSTACREPHERTLRRQQGSDHTPTTRERLARTADEQPLAIATPQPGKPPSPSASRADRRCPRRTRGQRPRRRCHVTRGSDGRRRPRRRIASAARCVMACHLSAALRHSPPRRALT